MDEPIELPTPEMLRAEAQLRLNTEVERIKQLEREGKRTPLATAQERHDKLKALSCDMLDLGSAIREALPILESLTIRAKKFSDDWRTWWCQNYEVVICEEHNEPLLVNEDESIRQSWLKQKNSVVWLSCPKCEQEKNRAALTVRWISAGIPQKVLHATFDNFLHGDEELKQFKAKLKFMEQSSIGKGFVLAVGNYGTGKSHLAAATIKYANSGIFVTMHDLIGELRQTYSDNTGQNTMVDKYRTAKVLVLDEVSDEIKGVDIPNLLYRILGYRHDHDLLTIITSNNKLAEVMAILGPKLMDRISTNYVVANFTWQSHRTKNANEL